jgi:LacI family transcriptional regulator
LTTSKQGRHPTTIYSVAQRAGVSIATVSRVLQGTSATSAQTRENVLRAVEELEYVPLQAARSLAVHRHEAHGLVLPDLTGPYYSELLMGYESAAAQLGQSVVIVVTSQRDDPPRAVRDLSSRVDGLVVANSTISDEAAGSLGRRIPVVLLARPAVAGCDVVSAENAQSAMALTEHLLAHGRRRLLFVGDPDGSPDVELRYRGFSAALSGSDMTAVGPAIRVAFQECSGAEVAAQVVCHNDPDALVCANDELALSTMKALQAAGVRVPDDIAIVGWDDVMTARYVSPGLTTVRQPLYELGRVAASRLHERITGDPTVPEPLILPTELVLRSSCGCPETDDRDAPWADTLGRTTAIGPSPTKKE